MKHDRTLEYMSYLVMAVLTGVQHFSDVVPLQVKITSFSMCCIIAGSYRSLFHMCNEFKKRYVKERKEGEEEEESAVETMGTKDAMQFPIMAGVMRCTLYGLIKYSGKDVVN